jgi:hypothetical protein
VETTDDTECGGWLNARVGAPIRTDLDRAEHADRERRLRLVLEILRARRREHRRAGVASPAGLRQSVADFGAQLDDVRRRRAQPSSEPRGD